MNPRTVFLRYTDAKGNTWVQSHRVWNVALFLETRAKQYAEEGGKAEKITEEIYEKERGKR